MQSIHPDIMYSVKNLSRHVSSPTVTTFQGIKHLIYYLDGCPYHPIMYIAGLDGATTHDLRQDVYLCDFHSQKISNDLVTFLCGLEVRALNVKRVTACAILYLLVFLFTGQPKPN